MLNPRLCRHRQSAVKVLSRMKVIIQVTVWYVSFYIIRIESTEHWGVKDFIFHVNEYTEIAGFPKVKLWVSCDEHDDLDIVVQIRKVDRNGQRKFPLAPFKFKFNIVRSSRRVKLCTSTRHKVRRYTRFQHD